MTGTRAMPPPSARPELVATVLLAWVALAAVPLLLGGIGLGWDALNHHIYLGWIADSPRFDRDFMAASYQSFQYPYLYWPVFKLYQLQVPGALAGALLASLNVAVVPALWLLAHRVVGERSWYGTTLRAMGVVLAFTTGVVLSHLDSTPNDLLAAIPLVWAVALGLLQPAPAALRWSILSGLCAGVAIAFKLSNGPLVVVLPLLWQAAGTGVRGKLAHIAAGTAGAVVSFALLYGFWGWQLWLHYGNPVYPFGDAWFAPVRDWLGHHP